MQFCPNEESKFISVINSNISICYQKLKDNENVIYYTTEAIKHDKLFIKPYINRAKAYEDTDKPEEALEGNEKFI